MRVADKDIAGKTAKVWHVKPSTGEMVLFAGLESNNIRPGGYLVGM
jgi:hypothetical protein